MKEKRIMRYLNSTADLPFHQIFGKYPDLLISFLNALLPLQPEETITEIEYLPLGMAPDTPLRKNGILDVRCKDNKGRHFIVEIEIIWSPEFTYRVLLHDAKAYARLLHPDKKYHLPEPVYSLNLVNEVFEPDAEEYYHYYRLVHVEHTDRVIDGLQLVFVELPKFKPHNYSEKKMHVLWLRFLTEINEKTREVPLELLESPEIKKAVTVLEESAFTPAQLLGYEKFWDIISVERTLMSSAERKGLKKGKEEGREEGRMEEKILIASNAKKQGLLPEMISSLTGLSLEEIERL